MTLTIISWIFTAIAIIGTVANSYQKRFGFWFWLTSNLFWVTFNIANGIYSQAAVYIFNSAMCIVGLRQWKKNKKEEKESAVQ